MSAAPILFIVTKAAKFEVWKVNGGKAICSRTACVVKEKNCENQAQS